MRLAARVALVALGLAIDALAVPPGPLPFLVLVADAPFLWLLRSDGGRRWKRWAFAYGTLHFGLALSWLVHVHPAHPFATALVLGLVYVPFGGAIRWGTRRGLPPLLLVPTAAVLEEMLRTVWFGGMPWPTRSLSLAASPVLTASSMAAGAYALSFLAALSSAAVAGVPDVWVRRRLPGSGRRALRLAAALVCAGAAGAGLHVVGDRRLASYDERLASGEVATTPPLLAIQGDVPQNLKRDATRGLPEEGRAGPGGEALDAANRVFRRHLDLTFEALSAQAGAGAPAFAVLWPETMIPWMLTDPALSRAHRTEWENQVRVFQNVATALPAGADPHLLLGAITVTAGDRPVTEPVEGHPQRDSLLLLRGGALPDPDGPYPPPPGDEGPEWVRGRHDKVTLVPGGEYTPLGRWIPPLRWVRGALSVGIPELEPGEPDQPPFDLGEAPRPGRGPLAIRAGTVICFEVVFPARCRSWRRRGAQVLLNASNYGWFGATAEEQARFRAQVEAIVRLRAAETGCTIVVAGNRGPTLFVDPVGRTYGTFRDGASGLPVEPVGGEATTYRTGWTTGVLRVDPEVVPYTRWGDLPWLAAGAVLLLWGALGALRARRPRPAAQAPAGPAPPPSQGA